MAACNTQLWQSWSVYALFNNPYVGHEVWRGTRRLKRQREEFTAMLEEHPSGKDSDSKGPLRFSTARQLFEDDSRWKVHLCLPACLSVIRLSG